MPAVYAAAASLAPPNSPQLLSHPTLPFVAMGPDHHAKEIKELPQKKTTQSVRKKRRAGSTVGVEWIYSAA